MPRLLVGDECDGIRFKYLAKPPSRDAPTFGRSPTIGVIVLQLWHWTGVLTGEKRYIRTEMVNEK
jgi:hypothetical protein